MEHKIKWQKILVKLLNGQNRTKCLEGEKSFVKTEKNLYHLNHNIHKISLKLLLLLKKVPKIYGRQDYDNIKKSAQWGQKSFKKLYNVSTESFKIFGKSNQITSNVW